MATNDYSLYNKCNNKYAEIQQGHKKCFTLKTFIYCTREKKTLETKIIASVNVCSGETNMKFSESHIFWYC